MSGDNMKDFFAVVGMLFVFLALFVSSIAGWVGYTSSGRLERRVEELERKGKTQ